MNVTRYKCSILVVDDDPAILSLLTSQLESEFEVLLASSSEEARGVFATRSIDIILSDLQLPGESGLSLLDWVRRTAPRTSRILISGAASLEDAADAINQSQVHRMILKPWRRDDLLQTLRAAARTLLLERSHEQLLDELRKLNLELEQRVADRTRELESALSQLQQKNHILEKMALTDPLTGLPNRRAIDLIARKELLRRARTPASIVLLLIDADHFGQVNKVHTQIGGDHVLIWLSGVLQNSIRVSDSLGRVGGEEFLVVAPETDAEGAIVLGERLRTAVESGKTIYNGKSIRMTISLGIAIADATSLASYDELRECAASALKQAKDTGRNRSVVLQFVTPAAE